MAITVLRRLIMSMNMLNPLTWSVFSPIDYELEAELIHPNQDPCTDQKVQLYLKWLFCEFKLGETYTNAKGRCKFKFKAYPLYVGQSENHLILKVVENKLKTSSSPGFFENRENTIYALEGKYAFSQRSILEPKVQIEYYEYQDDLPLLKKPQDSSYKPYRSELTHYIGLVAAKAQNKLHSLYSFLFKPISSLEGIVNSLGGKSDLELSPESTFELIFNGIYPCDPLKTNTPGLYEVSINWDRYEKKSSQPIPNVQLFFSFIDGKPTISSLIIQHEEEAAKKYFPSHPDFLKALYFFNCAAFCKGEIAQHIAYGHAYSEQCAIAVFRHLHQHPIRDLLSPHLRDIIQPPQLDIANQTDQTNLLALGPLTQNGVKQMIQDELAHLNYESFTPRKPLYSGHRFAQAGKLYWDITKNVVDHYFREKKIHHLDTKTQQNWYQIYYLSKSLVEHSLPYKPLAPYQQLLDPSEHDNPDLKRKIFDDKAKALTPITESQDKPSEQDIERLKQFCCHSIFMATFWHWWIHSSQKIWARNLHLASFAPKKDGALPFADIDPSIAKKQLLWASSLGDSEHPGILSNPNGDIYPLLISELRKHKEAFRKLGLNVSELPYGAIS